MSRKIIALFMMLLLEIQLPMIAHAGLKEMLNQMFVSTSTSPQAFQTQRLMGISGGSMTIRSVAKSIDVIQIAFPRVDVGCGGIDMFFGSFSFVNGQQFEQLIRAIAAATVAMAIKAAIQGMCNPCAAIINEIETAIRELNSLAKNTCGIANAILDGSAPDKLAKIAERGRNIACGIVTAVSRSSDWSACENSTLAKNVYESDANKDSNLRKQNPMSGNIVYRAVKANLESGNINTLQAFFSQTEIVQMIMSLYGTIILNPEAYNNNNNMNCPDGAAKCEKGAIEFGPTVNSFMELLYPRNYSGTNGLTVYQCGGQECTIPTTTQWSTSSWGGVMDILNQGMFGVNDPMSVASFSDFPSDSIVGFVISRGASNSISSMGNRILSTFSGVPVLKNMMELQKSPGAVVNLGHLVVNGYAPFIQYSIASEIHKIAKNAFTGQNTVSPPEAFLRNLKMREEELTAMMPDFKEQAALINNLGAIVKSYQEQIREQVYPN